MSETTRATPEERHRSGDTRRSTPSTRRVVREIAAREYVTRVRSKAFVLSTLLMFVVIVGGLIALKVFQSEFSDETSSLGVVGDSGQLGALLETTGEQIDQPVEVERLDDADSARDQVADGSLDAAVLVESGGGYTALSDEELSDGLLATIDAAVRQAALDEALVEQDVDPGQLSDRLSQAILTTTALDPPEDDEDQRTAIAYAAVLLLFITVFAYGIYVAVGVVEEKASRVVELLLSTVTPLQLLTGKVVGIGAVGLTQLLVLGGGGLVTALATGLLTIGVTAIGLFAITVVWYVLGFAFFALLYAAGGSLVSRQEDINSVVGPLNLVGFGAYFVAQLSLTNPDNAIVSVLAWIPPFSAYLMPLRIAQGVAPTVQILGTLALMLLACAVTAKVAAGIYQRSVLNTGVKRGWRDAFSRT